MSIDKVIFGNFSVGAKASNAQKQDAKYGASNTRRQKRIGY